MKLTGSAFVFIFGLLCTSYGYGQQGSPDVLKIGTTCEENIAAIEAVISSSFDEKAHMFIISHRSKMEQKNVDWTRLKYTRTAITQFRNFPPDKLTIAAGEPTDDKHGRLEFWVGGKLRLTSYVKKDQQFCFHI